MRRSEKLLYSMVQKSLIKSENLNKCRFTYLLIRIQELTMYIHPEREFTKALCLVVLLCLFIEFICDLYPGKGPSESSEIAI